MFGSEQTLSSSFQPSDPLHRIRGVQRDGEIGMIVLKDFLEVWALLMCFALIAFVFQFWHPRWSDARKSHKK
jgi:hypothetical protein